MRLVFRIIFSVQCFVYLRLSCCPFSLRLLITPLISSNFLVNFSGVWLSCLEGVWLSCLEGVWLSCLEGVWLSCLEGVWLSYLEGVCLSCLEEVFYPVQREFGYPIQREFGYPVQRKFSILSRGSLAILSRGSLAILSRHLDCLAPFLTKTSYYLAIQSCDYDMKNVYYRNVSSSRNQISTFLFS